MEVEAVTSGIGLSSKELKISILLERPQISPLFCAGAAQRYQVLPYRHRYPETS